MKISVNLASRPFVELRPFFARLRIIMVVLAVAAIALGVAMHFERQKLDIAQRQMNIIRDRTLTLQQEKLRNEARMRQPANAAVLDRAHFLNRLFLNKSFSWTGVMMDLENVLPTGVQVTAIEPAITAEGDVIIRLRVAGDRDRAVQLVRNLERSSRFISPRLSNETSQTKEQQNQAAAAAPGVPPGGVQFDIFANYNPLPPTEAPAKKSTTKTPSAESKPSAKISYAGKPAVRPGPNDGVVLKPFKPGATQQRSGGPR